MSEQTGGAVAATSTEPPGRDTRPAGPGPLHNVGRAADAFLRRREATILVVAIALLVYFQTARSAFLSHDNLVNVTQGTAPYAIVAVGEVLLLVSGEIDLSAGMVFTLAPFLMHYFVDYYGMYPILAIIVAVLVGGLVGLLNGAVTVLLRVPSFVATLGTMFLIQGITLTTSHAYPAQIPQAATGLAGWFGKADWSELIWCLIIVAFFHIVLIRTRWGLHTVAVGGNLVGASEAGIKVARIKIGNFMVTGALSAFAGILEAFRTSTIDPSSGGTGAMFTAVSAAVIGGTALAGGSGTVIGALLGALVLAELQNGFNLIGISANPFNIILGLAILVSMILNVHLARLRRAGRS